MSGRATRQTAGPATAAIVRAPGKINLVLRVGPRLPDGYHEVVSLMAAISLSDVITVAPAPATVVACPGVPGGDTLVTGALALLVEAAGHRSGFRVRIDKRIPVGAGLGGGSSDAGAVLRAANRLLPRPVTDARLRRIAAEIGSDVPFFLDPRPSLARGRGVDCVATGKRLPDCIVALASPGTSLATRDVYAAYRPRRTLPPSVHQPDTLDELAAIVENDLGAVAERLEPRSREIREALVERGALAAAVSGSGSAVFGLFRTEEAADNAMDSLPGAVWTARATLLTA